MRNLKSLAFAAAAFLLIAGGIVAQVFSAGAAEPEAAARAETRTIQGGEVEALLSEAVAERLLTTEFEIEMMGGWPSLAAPAAALDGPALLDLKIEPRTGRFQALVAGWAKAPASAQARLAGRIVRIESIPVPVRSIGAGEVIRDADLEWRRFPSGSLGQDPVLSAEAIIGKTPRRALRAGQPVRSGDLAVPLVVEKNAPVAMVYVAPGIQLTMMGKALEGGAAGQWIRVLNPQSKQIAYGTVTAEGLVTVSADGFGGETVQGMNEGEIW